MAFFGSTGLLHVCGRLERSAVAPRTATNAALESAIQHLTFKKSVLVLLLAVLLPSPLLSWLALHSAQEQGIIVERRTAELCRCDTRRRKKPTSFPTSRAN